MNELELLKKHEGFISKPYRDSEGLLTIGYGTLIEDGISEDEAQMLLEYRYYKIKDELNSKLYWIDGIGTVQQVVLYNMAYNMGVPNLLKFKKTLELVKNRDYNGASIEMLDSKWAKQVGDRAIELSQMMRS